MKSIFRTIVSVLVIASTILAMSANAANTTNTAQPYRLIDAPSYDRFINYVDGYSLCVDKGMSVDPRCFEVGAALESEDKRIEIYRQYVGDIGTAAYINYSNKFLENTQDHVTDYVGAQTIGSHDVHITAWHREKLAGIENDKNHYLCADISEENFCYSVLVKCTRPISEAGGYTYLLENFEFFTPSCAPTIEKTKTRTIEERGWNEETAAFYEKYLADEAKQSWGIFEPDASYFNYATLENYESYFEYSFPVLLNYSEFESKEKHHDLKQRLEDAYQHGKVLELTLQTPTAGSGSNLVYAILNGEYDAFLQDYAKTVADFAHPVLFRLCNEMNGDWCNYSAYHTARDTAVFREFYRYVYRFFEEAHADNVIWIWNPNCRSFPDFNWNHEWMYYPGDEYVDVVGLTAYNTGNYYASVGERWQEFDELYRELYRESCLRFSQPLMITEFSCASAGGSKENWVDTMFRSIRGYDKIKLAIWWDGCDYDANGNVARSYFMDETPQLMEVFKNHLSTWNDGAPLKDVCEKDWFFDDVAYVRSKGLMNGTSVDTFSPDAPVSRAMLAAILYRMDGKADLTATHPFDDVPVGSYYEAAAAWAYANGLMDSDGAAFYPNRYARREEMIVALYRCAQYKKYDLSAASDLLHYSDVDNISADAVPAFRWACGAGILRGDSNGALAPNAALSRAQFAALLHRFCAYSADTK